MELGSIVVYKDTNVTMTVRGINGDLVECIWFETAGYDSNGPIRILKEAYFLESSLTVVNRPYIQNFEFSKKEKIKKQKKKKSIKIKLRKIDI